MNDASSTLARAMPASADLLQPDAINMRLRAKRGSEAVRELHAELHRLGAVVDGGLFLRELLARQTLGAICVDQEIALPHARTAAVNRIVFAIGRSDAGIYFDAQHSRIKLVFVIGSPVSAVTEYLHWTARIVRRLRDRTIREQLLRTEDISEVPRLLSSSPDISFQ